MSEPREIPVHIIESLKSLGLTKYEALVYIGLLRVAGATATEIHEISGVPRASVYPVLDRLMQKSLVSVSHTSPKRFNATPPDDGIDSLMHRIEEDAAQAREALTAIYREKAEEHRADQEFIWSIYGQENIQGRLTDLIRNAGKEIRMVANWNLLSETILPLLRQARGAIAVEVVTDFWEGEVPEGVAVHVHRHCMKHEQCENHPPMENAGVFIVDGAKVLVWMGSSGEETSALYSESPGFVQFFSRYWTNIRDWVKLSNQ
ncbi:TrmB family transcriptional regulator [Methanoculleus sp. FWC-SCC1]|uniref:TrmB family transcriptional regulator n=1 Tax=Methanoculleus frigidifontis TaxID=2584085 RepID=A0ABT8ME58_9EURY|nr:TrmB family transcriptional regulator [Methanoculleus sp. FWC-SCC1]MDN7026135.1 TrmB family transcriptional regulator [Methanoculleus sp. FWC-SCC1]